MLALSIFDKAEVENTNPPTNAKTIEAKIPKIVMYCVCCLFKFSFNSLYFLSSPLETFLILFILSLESCSLMHSKFIWS